MGKIESVRLAYGDMVEEADVDRAKEIISLPRHVYAEGRFDQLREARDLLLGFAVAKAGLTGGNLPGDTVRRMGEKERAKGPAWSLEGRARAWAKAAGLDDVEWTERSELRMSTEVRQAIVLKILHEYELKDIPDGYVWDLVESLRREVATLACAVLEMDRMDWLPFLRKADEDYKRLSRVASEMKERGEAVMDRAEGERIDSRVQKRIDSGLAADEDDMMWSDLDDLHGLVE